MRVQIWLLALPLLLAGCSSKEGETLPSPKARAPLAVPKLTDADVREEIKKLPPLLRQQFKTKAGKREFKRALTDKQLLIAEARRLGYQDRPEIKKEVSALEERLIIKALLKEEEKKRPVTEADARRFYDRNKERYKTKEALRISRILFRAKRDDERARTAARKKAEAALRKLKRGADFASVAKTGEGPERARAGDLGFIEIPNHRHRKLLHAADPLKPGELTGLIEDEDGVSIAKVTERRKPKLRSFEDVKSRVMTDMLPRRQRAVFDDTIKRLRQANEPLSPDESL